MASWRTTLLSLPVVAVLLGALTLGLVYLGRYWGLGVATLFLLAVPIVLAALYLWYYSTLPYAPRSAAPTRAPSPVPAGAADETFEDPVVEADELDRASHSEVPPESPTVVEDDAREDAPRAP